MKSKRSVTCSKHCQRKKFLPIPLADMPILGPSNSAANTDMMS